MRKIYLLVLVLLGVAEGALSQVQESEDLKEVIDYATPSVEGQGKSKGIVIAYERQPRFNIKSASENPRIGNGNGRVSRFNRFEVRAFVPVMNKPRTKLIVGFDHSFEEYNFSETNGYSLYQNLEEKNLRSIGAQVAFLRSLDNQKFYLVRVKGELNGDYRAGEVNVNDYLKTTLDVAYGWKKTPSFSWGIGVQMGYTYGRRSILPAILYNRTFNERWGIESIFPANVIVRRNVSEKTLLFGGYKLEGASYNLNATSGALGEFNPIELRRTDIKGMLRLEQEIYDFLWFGVEGGYRQYFRNRIFDENGTRDVLISNDLSGAGYVRVELFLVPPRRFLEKNK